MAASSSKPTAVHFALVFFVLVSLVCGLMWYVEGAAHAQEFKRANEEKDKAAQANTAARTALDELETCKKWLFGATAVPSTFGGADPNSVEGKVKAHFTKYGKDLSEHSYDMVLTKQDETLRLRIDELDKTKQALAVAQATIKDLEGKYNAMLASEKDSRNKAETDVQTVTKSKDETVKQLEKDVQDLKTALTEADIKFESEKQAFEKEKGILNRRIQEFVILNQQLREKLDDATKTSFEVPTGYVRYVDSANRLVYINLGSADKLPLRTTFSVYAKNNSGVGRGKEDIKGQIEVTRLVDAHTAECRIQPGEDIHNPIAGGDPIYTPLWVPGQPLRFALIGKIDLNGDGQSDREQLHQMLKNVGAQIDSEVDDQGEHIVRVKSDDNPLGINEQTKFLVLGRLPDLSEATDAEDTARIQKIQQLKTELQQTAREHGVRIVTLPDFLAWMGFRSEQRLFKPGTEQPYTLSSGSRSTAVDSARGDRTSTGAVSRSADQSKRNLKPATSNTTTNKLFK